MLALVIGWLLLGLVCFCLGTTVLNLLKLDGIKSASDRFFIAQWIGLVITADIFLFISLFCPLIPIVSISIALIIVILSLIPKRNRQELSQLIQQLSPRKILGIFCLILFTAIFNPRDIFWYDTGLYHYQVTQWLAKTGAVDGLAQVHSRFGFTSSWFALSAVFDHGLLETRIGSLVNGFVALLTIGQILEKFQRIIFSKRNDYINYFIPFAYSVISITSFYESLDLSLSPDFPVIVLTVFIGWLLLVSSKVAIDVSLILVILSAGAIAIKLSAIPLLVISFIYVLIRRQNLVRKLIIGSSLTLLLILPSILYAVKVSGCPLFPSGFMCLDLPWAYNSESANQISQIIRDFARWSGVTPAGANWWNWLPMWIEREMQATIQILLSLLTCLLLIKYKQQIAGQMFIFLLGFVGITFMMAQAPVWRFGLGYLTVIPALGLAVFLSKVHHRILDFFKRLKSVSKYLASPLMWIALLIIWSVIFRQRVVKWLVPPPLKQPEILLTKEIDGIKYTMPTKGDDRCWSASIPCTPEDLENRVKLLRPELGIAGGFAKVK
jgi:hypothetical protein